MLSLPFQDVTTPPLKPSGRKGSRKVRTGCITCKIRKVKCDETKPHCHRCTKTGRQCDGYKSPSPQSTPSPLRLSPVPDFESSQESRAFDFYRSRSAKILSGAIDANFWGGLVIKLSATEPAVRHAILAVSSLHECVDVKSATGRELDRSFAFREYGNAIQSLRNWTQRDEPSAIPLIVCLLFICIEFLADRDVASQMHISQGRNILSGLVDNHSPAMEVVKQTLVPMYARLSLASFLFGNRPAPIPGHLKRWVQVPAIFATLEEARCSLYFILDEGLQFSTRAYQVAYNPAADAEQVHCLQVEQQRLLSQAARWQAAFTLLTSMTPQSAASINVQTLLKVYHQASLIWISTALQPTEVAYDAHLPAFSNIISLASSIIDSLPSNSKMESFSFETELIAPVYWTATKCRHPLLRRAALQLLTRDKMRNRRENLWHVRETTVIAARVIEKEENELYSSSVAASAKGQSKPEYSYDNSEFTSQLSPGDLKVSITNAPSLIPPKPSFIDPTDDALDRGFTPDPPTDGADEPVSTTSIAVEALQRLDLAAISASNLESPFGIPECQRIKNTVIGTPEKGGIWATYFKEPPAGETEWNVVREFLKC